MSMFEDSHDGLDDPEIDPEEDFNVRAGLGYHHDDHNEYGETKVIVAGHTIKAPFEWDRNADIGYLTLAGEDPDDMPDELDGYHIIGDPFDETGDSL